MSTATQDVIPATRALSLSRAFSRLGWIGFWIQVVLGSLPILLMIYYFTFSHTGSVTRSGLPFIEYLTLANLVILLFTLFWSYRYTLLAKRLMDPQKSPTELSLRRAVWTGVAATTGAMILSNFILLIEGGNLLFNFLKVPQNGIPVIPTGGAEASSLVSSIDMVSLMALLLTLFAELVVLICSLWLLYRTTHGSTPVIAGAPTK